MGFAGAIPILARHWKSRIYVPSISEPSEERTKGRTARQSAAERGLGQASFQCAKEAGRTQIYESRLWLLSGDIAATGPENDGMPDKTELHLKITRGPPFWWEIYRGNDPQWEERSMFGYLMENEARLDGEAALHRLINREIQAKRTVRP